MAGILDEGGNPVLDEAGNAVLDEAGSSPSSDGSVYGPTYGSVYPGGATAVLVNTYTAAQIQPLSVSGLPSPGALSMPLPVSNTDGNWLIAVLSWLNPSAINVP